MDPQHNKQAAQQVGPSRSNRQTATDQDGRAGRKGTSSHGDEAHQTLMFPTQDCGFLASFPKYQ